MEAIDHLKCGEPVWQGTGYVCAVHPRVKVNKPRKAATAEEKAASKKTSQPVRRGKRASHARAQAATAAASTMARTGQFPADTAVVDQLDAIEAKLDAILDVVLATASPAREQEAEGRSGAPARPSKPEGEGGKKEPKKK